MFSTPNFPTLLYKQKVLDPYDAKQEPVKTLYYLEGVDFCLDDQKTGDLIVAEPFLIWVDVANGSSTFIPYTEILLHAISREDPVHGSCIYIQLDSQNDELRELYLVTDKVDEVFQALCECSALCPDPVEEEEMDEETLKRKVSMLESVIR